MKNQNNNRPFYAAEIEIIDIDMCDIIVTSPNGPDPFPGEDDEFEILYWEQ